MSVNLTFLKVVSSVLVSAMWISFLIMGWDAILTVGTLTMVSATFFFSITIVAMIVLCLIIMAIWEVEIEIDR